MKKFKNIIGRARKSKGITQKQLAEMLDCKQQQVSKYETSVNLPSVEKLVDIAEALDVSLDELIEIKRLHENN